jgi:hypothetical protein
MATFFYLKDGNGRPTLVNRDLIRWMTRPELKDQGLYIKFDSGEGLTVEKGPESDRVWKDFASGLPDYQKAIMKAEDEPRERGEQDEILFRSTGDSLSKKMKGY